METTNTIYYMNLVRNKLQGRPKQDAKSSLGINIMATQQTPCVETVGSHKLSLRAVGEGRPLGQFPPKLQVASFSYPGPALTGNESTSKIATFRNVINQYKSSDVLQSSWR